MKSILFATTALVATVGMASADVTFSGKGEAGVSQTEKVEGKASTLKAGTFAQTTGSNIAAVTVTTTATQRDLKIVLTDTTNAAVYTDVVDANGAGLEKDVTDAKAALKAALADGSTDAEVAQAAYAVELAELLFAANANAAVTAKAAGDMKAYSGYDLNVAVSGSTDSGMTFAMGFDMGAGNIADQDDDRVLDAQGSAVGTSALTVTTADGTVIKIGQDKIDDLYDDSQNGDIGVSGKMGGLSFNIVTDLEDDVAAVAATQNSYAAAIVGTASANEAIDSAEIVGYTAGTAATAAVWNTTSYSFGYAVSDALSVSLVGTTGNDRGNSANKVSFSYTVNDSLSLVLGHNSEGKRDGITKLSATYAIDALTITASYADDKDHAGNSNTGKKASTNLKVGYTQGAVSATFATDESSQWWVNTKYDLGGGASAFATVDHQEFAVAGLSFAF